MTDPSKPSSPFSFGPPATSGNAGVNFGQGTSDASKQGGAISNPPTTSNIFGTTSTPSANSSVFGNAFAGGANKSSTGFNFSFGQTQNNKTSGGSGQTSSQNTQPSTTAPAPGPFSVFSTPSKLSEQPPSGQGQGGSTGPFSFGNAALNASSAGQTSTTTPTSKPTTNIFANSTTPAGPPPSSGTSTGAGMFGKPPQAAGNPFGSFGTTSSAPGTNTTTAPSGGSGGLAFGASKPQASPAATPSTQPQSIFASTPNTGGSNLFSNKSTPQPSGGIFGNLNKNQDNGNNTATNPQQNEPPKSLFNLGGQSSTKAPITQSTSGSGFSSFLSKPASFGTSGPSTTAPATNMFANLGKPQDAPAPPTATPNMFANLGKSQVASAPPTTAPSSGMFANLGKPQEKDKAPATSAEMTSISASATSTPASTSNLFAPKPADTAPTSQVSDKPTTTGTAQGTGGTIASLGASTAGPAPPAQSRLKNKSMDDIITRWAADLSKYQKEFQQQATKVAAWDRTLVENSEKIQKLYGSTLEAERATTEVERQLTAVENDQAELSMWLDHYEREVDSMISSSIGQGDALSGPDQERERT